MAARIVFTEKELKKLTDEFDSGKFTKTALAKAWGIGVQKLNNEVESYKAKLAKKDQLKQNKKGTPLSKEEIEDIIIGYTKEHLSMNKIANQLMRSLGAVRAALEKNGIPIRSKTSTKPITGDKTSPLSIGDLVYSIRHNMYGEVLSCSNEQDAFGIWVEEKEGITLKKSFHMYDKRENLVKIKEVE